MTGFKRYNNFSVFFRRAYFVQTLLIIISVLLAFILNEYRENARELLSKNAWSFIQQNGIKLDYEHSTALNSTYLIQDEFFRNSVEKLANIIVQRETHRPELLRETLLLMHLLAGEIVGQGQALTVQYQLTLDLIGGR